MKKFLTHISLYASPVALLLFFIWLRPVGLKQKWNRINDNCGKSACLVDLLLADKNIDVAFVGTSRTMNAVIDTSLSKRWGVRVANLGYCRPGRNMQLEILDLLFQHHSPRAVFIELGQEEDWYGHYDFGNVAETAKVVKSLTSRNPKYFRDLRQNFVMKYDLFQKKLFDEPYPSIQCDYGFGNSLTKGTSLSPISRADTNSTSQRFTSIYYLNKMLELAEQNQCAVFFHYLPTNGLIEYPPHQLEFYEHQGTVVFPPRALNNQELWADNSHIILKGAVIYTNHLSWVVKRESLK